jgi:hypothetical protein
LWKSRSKCEFLTGFGVQPGNLIRYRTQNTTCYASCEESCLSNLHIYRTIESEDSNGDGIYDSNDNGYNNSSGQAISYANYQASNLTANNIIRNYANVNYIAENSVYLSDGFYVDDTSVFEAYIDLCSGVSSAKNLNKEMSLRSEIDVIEFNDKVQIFPNPTSKDLTIKVETDINSVFVLNSNGVELYRKKSINKNSFMLDASNFRPGLYFIKIELITGHTFIEKFIVSHN